MDCHVHTIAHLTAAQRGTRVLDSALISFVRAGQALMRVDTTRLIDPAPYLAILPKGATVEFDYTAERDQWAILFDLAGLTAGRKPGTVELVVAGESSPLVLPTFTPIVKEHLSGWEGEFLRMRDAFRTPGPASRIRVQTGIGNVFRYVIDQRPDVYPSAAAKLRRLLDEDQQMRYNLSELSRQCGYSPSRLRVLFERDYGQSPQTYRLRQRLHIAADLLCNSDQRIKEISERIGCRHVSHFCSLFKETYGLTPTRYQRKFDQRHPSQPAIK